MRKIILAAVILGGPAAAQTVDQPQTLQAVTTPAKGSEQTVSVGSSIYEYGRYEAFDVAFASKTMRVAPLLVPLIIEAETPLFSVMTTKKFKGCAGVGGGGLCAIDDDGDGSFDRIATDSSSTAIKLKEPVPYRIEKMPREAPGSIKKVIVYAGATSDTLRLSYREFRDNFARPAFTEELSIPIMRQFPEVVAVKDIRIVVLSISGLGLRYKLD